MGTCASAPADALQQKGAPKTACAGDASSAPGDAEPSASGPIAAFQNEYEAASVAVSSLLSRHDAVLRSVHFPSSTSCSLSPKVANSSTIATDVSMTEALTTLGAEVDDDALGSEVIDQVVAIVKQNKQLGEGSFGQVFKGFIEGEGVAVKVVRYQDAAKVRDEIIASMALDHPNLVRTLLAFQRKLGAPRSSSHGADDSDDEDGGDDGAAAFQAIDIVRKRTQLVENPLDWDNDDNDDEWEHRCSDDPDDDNYSRDVNELFIVQELCNMGQLASMIVNGSLAGERHLRRALVFALDIAKGLAYMHKFNVLHLDLKPHNVLLHRKDGERPRCKIADFGVSRAMPLDMHTVNTGRCGTAVYCPAEMVMHGKVSPTADVYSMSIIIGEMMTGRLLHSGMSMAQAVVAVVTHGLRPELEPWVPERLRDLLQRSWDADRTRRPSARQFADELRTVMRAVGRKRQASPQMSTAPQ